MSSHNSNNSSSNGIGSNEERIPGTEDYQDELDHDELYGEEEEEGEGGGNGEDPEIEEMRKRVQEMEEEQEKLTNLQHQVEKQIHSAADSLDENSVFVLFLSLSFYSNLSLSALCLTVSLSVCCFVDMLDKSIMKQPPMN